MNKSLSRFFKRNADATLDSCDREQIHLSGMVQKGTGLLVINPADTRVIGVSQNIDKFLDMPAAAIIGLSLKLISEEVAQELIELEESNGITHQILNAQIDADGEVHDVLTHSHDGLRFVEFLPNTEPAPVLLRKRMRLCGAACSQIIGSDSFEEATQIAVDAVRQMTGLDRVKIYRFLPDWSGEVIAESRSDKMASLIGLHFPDSDIPRQVRDMMTIVPSRIIIDVHDDNIPICTIPEYSGKLDMTWVTSRSSSAMHTAYLRNIGAKSAFSTSLIGKGKLWG